MKNLDVISENIFYQIGSSASEELPTPGGHQREGNRLGAPEVDAQRGWGSNIKLMTKIKDHLPSLQLRSELRTRLSIGWLGREMVRSGRTAFRQRETTSE